MTTELVKEATEKLAELAGKAEAVRAVERVVRDVRADWRSEIIAEVVRRLEESK